MDIASAVSTAGAISLEKIKGDIVTGTLRALHSSSGTNKKDAASAMKQSYDFNKSVLSSVYEGKGTLVDSNNGNGIPGSLSSIS